MAFNFVLFITAAALFACAGKLTTGDAEDEEDAAPDGDDGRDEVDVPVPCTQDETRCNADGEREQCSATGIWVAFPCPAGQVCRGAGECSETACDPGETRCDPGDPTRVEVCNDTQTGWVFSEVCADGSVCQLGACVPTTCEPGSTTCTPDGRIRTCNESGTGYGPAESCEPGFACVDTACVELVCVPGEAQCLDAVTLGICNPAGTGFDEEPCDEDWICLGDQCLQQVCNPGERSCLGTMTVRQCNDTGTGFDILGTCDAAMDEQCMDGDCLASCERAERAYASVGCLFYGADLDQADQMYADDSDFAIVAINAHDSLEATVTIEDRRGSGGTWRTRAAQTLAPGDTYTFRLTPDQHHEETGLAEGFAYRVSSDVPIAAYQFNPIDATDEYTTDASLLLPASTLGTQYRVAAGPALSTYGFQSFMTVVGARDATSLSITVSADTRAGGVIPALSAGDTYTADIDEGDVLQLASAASEGDLSGTYVESTAPVAVFGGSECSNIPTGCSFCVNAGGTSVPSCGWCDHLEEQMIPIQAWGRNYVAGRTPVLSTGGVEGSYWKVLAAEDATSVDVAVAPGTVLRTDAGAPPFILNAGDMLHLELAGTASAPGDALITADKPVLAVQYMEGAQCTDRTSEAGGDPSMILAVPAEQYLEAYPFITPSGYAQNHVVVIKQAGTSVFLDGTVLSGTAFPVASGWQVYRPTIGEGAHEASGDGPFAVLCTGTNPYSSYGYMAGLSLYPISAP